jgi:hypothetical protein
VILLIVVAEGGPGPLFGRQQMATSVAAVGAPMPFAIERAVCSACGLCWQSTHASSCCCSCGRRGEVLTVLQRMCVSPVTMRPASLSRATEGERYSSIDKLLFASPLPARLSPSVRHPLSDQSSDSGDSSGASREEEDELATGARPRAAGEIVIHTAALGSNPESPSADRRAACDVACTVMGVPATLGTEHTSTGHADIAIAAPVPTVVNGEDGRTQAISQAPAFFLPRPALFAGYSVGKRGRSSWRPLR